MQSITGNYAAQLADRERERNQVATFLSDSLGPRCLVFRASAAVGATFFARAVADMYSSFAYYHDCSQATLSLAESTLTAAARASFLARTQIYLASKGVGGTVTSILGYLLPALSIPLWGGSVELAGVLPAFPLSRYPTPAVELLARSLSGRIWRPKKVLLVADNTQDAVADLRDILSGLHSNAYHQVKFLLFYIEREKASLSYAEWIRRIRTTGVQVIESAFAGPHEHVVGALAAKRSVYLTGQEIHRIVDAANDNIYTVLELVAGAQVDRPSGTTRHLELYVLTLLWLGRQPLRLSDILTMATTSSLVYFPDEQTFDQVLMKLATKGLVEKAITEDRDQLLYLSATSSPQLRHLEDDHAQKLAVAGEMYEYFRRVDMISVRHSEASVARLLYQLARLVDHASVAVHAQRIVRVAMGKGSISLARQYIEDACETTPLTVEDLYLRLAYFVSAQDYEGAAALLSDSPAEWATKRLFRILRAVIDNRLRCHSDSLAEIDRLLQDDVSAEERTVLASYKVAGLLHEGHYEAAMKLFSDERQAVAKAENYGYFLRNGAAVFLWLAEPRYDEASEVLGSARRLFKNQKDWFGFYTTLSNTGTISAYRKNLKTALAQFKEAFEHLSIFGTHHLEEVGFNYAAALALVGDLVEASQRTDSMLAFFEHANFPRIQLLSLRAILHLLNGGDEEARSVMDQAAEEVVGLDLIEAKLYVVLNSAVVEAVTKAGDRRLRRLLTEAEELCFGFSSDKVQRVTEAIQVDGVSRSEALGLFSFDFHQYWSQNPFELLPPSSLAL